MAAPARRVFSYSVPVRLCPVQHSLDTSPNATRGLGFCCPDWLKHLCDFSSANRLDRQTPYDGKRIGFERRTPLGRVLCAAPAGAVSDDVGIRAGLERNRAAGLELRLLLLSSP